MGVLSLAFATCFLLTPNERHIDFSGWPGAVTVEFDVRITALDGTVFKTTIELAPEATVIQARDILWFPLKRNGWRGHTVGKGILVLEGSKKSPIRSVEFTSKGWKPAVRTVLNVPQKK
jgi:hypothetical protein